MNNHPVDFLVEEYTALLHEAGNGEDELLKRLEKDSEWGPVAAKHIVKLATDNGSFMLRNALALSIAMKHEDGDLGF